MRLAQLARKIQVKPSELINFILNQFDHKINSTPNTVIPKEYLGAIVEHFVLKKETNDTTHKVIEKTVAEVEQCTVTEPESTEKVEIEETESTEETEETILNIEDGVIRAPKVKIEGVTVVGKIELPTKPEVQEEEKEEAKETVEKSEKPKPTRIPRTPQKTKNGRKSELNYEEEKQKERQAYKEELRRKKELAKKKKRAHYEAMVKEKGTKLPKKKKPTKAQQLQTEIEKKKENRPTSLWGRFIYWLNN